MAIIRLPIANTAPGGRSPFLSPATVVNLYHETEPGNPETPIALVGIPGLAVYKYLGTGAVRGLYVYGDSLYAVSGDTLQRVDSAGVISTVGTLATSSGPVSFADNGIANGKQLMLVDGPHGYIWDGTTLTQIADANFPGGDRVVFNDGRFLVNHPGTGQFCWSALYDGLTWDGLSFATAEASPDNLVAIAENALTLYLIGTATTELWYNSGGLDSPYTRLAGGFFDRGCVAAASVTNCDNTLFWLSSDRRGQGLVVRAAGTGVSVVSTPQLNDRLAGFSRIDDAIGWSYQQDAHEFYVLCFPTARETWAYDVSTKRWTQRSTWNDGHDLWRPTCHAFFNGKHCVGGLDAGTVYTLESGLNTDAGGTLMAEVTTDIFEKQQRYITVNELQLALETGHGGSVSLEISDDRGTTWKVPRSASLGTVPNTRARWVGLGAARNRAFRFRIADAVPRIIYGLQADVT